MFQSLRTRLWLSYALLIGAALAVVGLVLAVYLVRNPLLYREETSRLRAVSTLLVDSRAELERMPVDALASALIRLDRSFDVRILAFNENDRLLVDTRAETAAPLDLPRLMRPADKMLQLRDADGAFWLYTLHPLPNGRVLLLAVPRPRLRLAVLLRDELIAPLLQGALVALVLSLLLAYGMTRWIGDPLQKVVSAARVFPQGSGQPLPQKGPREVQDLVHAFNQMTGRVQASQRSQRDFVANVSHELKTPLTSIQGFAQSILDGTADTRASQQQAAQVIFNEANRMHSMVLDLLDLARLDAGTADLKMAAVDIPALLRGVAERFMPQAAAASVTLTVQVDELPQLIGDGDRLAQVFNNLVDNALKFTPAGGQVVLRAGLQDGDMLVAVTDSGAGIPPEALARIFDRFYQVDPSRRGGEQHGSGLGLAIASEIVQAHGGTIEAASQVGQGTVFRVRLPLSRPDATTLISRRRR